MYNSVCWEISFWQWPQPQKNQRTPKEQVYCNLCHWSVAVFKAVVRGRAWCGSYHQNEPPKNVENQLSTNGSVYRSCSEVKGACSQEKFTKEFHCICLYSTAPATKSDTWVSPSIYCACHKMWYIVLKIFHSRYGYTPPKKPFRSCEYCFLTWPKGT